MLLKINYETMRKSGFFRVDADSVEEAIGMVYLHLVKLSNAKTAPMVRITAIKDISSWKMAEEEKK